LVKHSGRAASGYTNIHTEQIGSLRRQWEEEPHKVENQPPDVISYDEWLAGRPCLSEGFAFGLGPLLQA
jgi:hypothetical protein